MNETLNKIFENKDNKVTLSLSDYESIKAVFDENKALKEEIKDLNDSLSNVSKVFIKAKLPESVLKDIQEDKVVIDSKIMYNAIEDPLFTTYAILIRARNREQ